jgi:hypothetical protein
MRTIHLALSLVAALALCTLAVPARADTDIAGGLLIGSGVDTGDGENNPYQLQIGGFVEVIANHYVLGFRATRTRGSNVDHACDVTGNDCNVYVDDLRSIGGDLGFEWDLLLLHLSPRLGIGSVSEVDSGRKALYLDPGGVLDLEVGPFMAGVDVRYRFAVDESDLNGLMVLARIGLRF